MEDCSGFFFPGCRISFLGLKRAAVVKNLDRFLSVLAWLRKAGMVEIGNLLSFVKKVVVGLFAGRSHSKLPRMIFGPSVLPAGFFLSIRAGESLRIMLRRRKK